MSEWDYKREDYATALNAHVNILLECKRMNPQYYSNTVWMVRYKDFIYDVRLENISALFVIDYMRKRQFETFLGFTLHKHEDGEHYWLTVKI
jgi:ABC-type oligopeptide transport system substrate-binding subunit